MRTYVVEWRTFGYHKKEIQAASEHELRSRIERQCPQMLPITITEKKGAQNESTAGH